MNKYKWIGEPDILLVIPSKPPVRIRPDADGKFEATDEQIELIRKKYADKIVEVE